MGQVGRPGGWVFLSGPLGFRRSVVGNERNDAGIIERREAVGSAGAIAIGIVNAILPRGWEFPTDRGPQRVNGATDTLSNLSAEGNAARILLIGSLHDLAGMSECFGQFDRHGAPR